MGFDIRLSSILLSKDILRIARAGTSGEGLEIVGIKVFKAYRLKRAFSYSVIEEVVYPDGLSKLIRSKRSVNIGLDTIFSA